MKVLVLSSSTGGGHDMRARSLKLWMERPENAPHWECRIHQALESAHAFYRFGVWLYNTIQTTSPRLHHVYFNILEMLRATRSRRNLLGSRHFVALLKEFKPDLVVSTHGHLNHAFFDLARETLGRDQVRCVTYCGELFGGYGFARGWVNPSASAFIGAVKDCRDHACSLGMPENRALVGGFLLHPNFFAAPEPGERERLFAELDLDPDRFTLLLSTGANGATNHRACVEACDRAGLPIQLIALCGINERAREQLTGFRPRTAGLQLRALGHRKDMPRLLRSVSVVFARPGTGTCSEAMVSRCPILFNAIGGTMPQERITIRFANAHGISLGTIRRPGQLPALLNEFSIGDPPQPKVTCTQAETGDDTLGAIRERMKQINTGLTPQRILELLASWPLTGHRTPASEGDSGPSVT